MTVCLAILSPSDNAAIVAADRMVTGGTPEVEFEHEGSKIEHLAPNCVALTAGNALIARNLFREVRRRLGELTAPSILSIVNTVKEAFVVQRLGLAEDLYLRGRGVTVETFYEHYLDKWPEGLVSTLDQAIQNTTLDVHVLIAGVDSEPHMYVIENPGKATCFDTLGFCAIGSGTPLATLQWIARCPGPARSLAQAAYIAHEAKLKSEAHPGVGQETDMVVVRPGNSIELPQKQIQALRAEQLEIAAQDLPDMDLLTGQLRMLLEEDDDTEGEENAETS